MCSGLTTILRAIPYHGGVNQIYLPKDIMAKYNVRQNAALGKMRGY